MKHGMSRGGNNGRHRLYLIRSGIIGRCNRKSDSNYYNYGGRGIRCEWNNFIEFRDDMYNSYLEHIEKFGEKQTTIDRINNDGNYCKDNCRWATYYIQSYNRRNNVKIKLSNGGGYLVLKNRKYKRKILIRLKDIIDTKEYKIIKKRYGNKIPHKDIIELYLTLKSK